MSSLSHASRLADLPSAHDAFQGHAAHRIEWSICLGPRTQRVLGRHRARCLTVRLPMPPVRPVRATFTAHGSRERDVYRKLPFRKLHGAFTVVSLRIR